MSQNKHTPGPWTPTRSPGLHDGAHDYAISAKGAPVLSEAFGRGALGEWLPAEANAALIAAAPDMLAALREIEAICTETQSVFNKRMGTRVGNCLTTALAAIAKAEGRP